MHDHDCCHHDGPHRSPFGLYGPYDPVHHHHHKHPPYLVDRCAEQCDDQLPLFSQVGRGLRGDSYKVEVQKDSLTETILEGLYVDEHTGALVSDWISENINGGHLSYQYNLRPFTDPQTFTITFKYVRPGRNADENGTVWSWTTPAIPYLWSRQEDGSMSDGEDIVGTGVATLYLKKTTDGPWNWRQHEKLVYPDGFTHEDMNAPDPLEGWTVNLQYGIGGDIDAPNIDDLAKVLGITVQNIRNIILNSPEPTEIIDQPNLKKYIDWAADQAVSGVVVSSTKPAALGVQRVDTPRSGNTPKQTEFKLTPEKPTAGDGISITEGSDGKITIANSGVVRILAGPGIDVSNLGNGVYRVSSSENVSSPTYLVPGTDYDYVWHGNWYGRANALPDSGHPAKPSSGLRSPHVTIIPSYDLDGNIVGGNVTIASHNKDDDHPERICLIENGNAIDDTDNFMLKHSALFDSTDSRATAKKSLICSITFKGIYAALNNKRVVNARSSGIWNVKATRESNIRTADSSTWRNTGASWEPTLEVVKNLSSIQGNFYQECKTFSIYAAGISDGYNDQYSRHLPDGYAHQAIRGWANMKVNFILI